MNLEFYYSIEHTAFCALKPHFMPPSTEDARGESKKKKKSTTRVIARQINWDTKERKTGKDTHRRKLETFSTRQFPTTSLRSHPTDAQRVRRKCSIFTQQATPWQEQLQNALFLHLNIRRVTLTVSPSSGNWWKSPICMIKFASLQI